MKTKSLTDVKIKDADQGVISGVFCTYDVVDRDGDVHRKGCFAEGAKVVISAYGHKSWEGELPVGVGTIHTQGNEARFEAKFLLDTPHGMSTWQTIKALSDEGLQEWSYSLYDVEAERGQFQGKSVRFINKVGLVKEVSPTLMGAGINTRTLDTKGADVKQLVSMVSRLLSDAGRARWETGYSYVYVDDFDLDAGTVVYCVIDYSEGTRESYMVQVDFTRTDTSVSLGETETHVEATTLYLPKGSKFSEHKDVALRGLKSLVEMAVNRLAERGTEGKSTTEQTDAYTELVAELEPLKSAIDEAATQPPLADDDFANEVVRYLSLQGAPS